MRERIRALGQAIQRNNGWHKLGVAVGLCIIAFAFLTLFQLLRDIEIDKVVTALRLTSPLQIIVAGGFVAASYVTLTFYDFFSLRTIGRRDVPYRIAAMASFVSYTIGHNLGATVFTASAIRFRVYSAWGLGVVDVVKIAFITGLTFWMGNAFVLGLGLLWAPEAATAITQLPPWLNRAIAVGGLVIIAGYLLWQLPQPRIIGRAGWQITLPCARLTLVQIGIGVLDLTAGALAMYALLPADPAIDFVTLLVIFVAAALLGFLSHAPGSLGVFEAAMLVALPQFQKEELLASLLSFRVLYFMLPLLAAVLLLSAREGWLASKMAAGKTCDAATKGRQLS